MSFFRVPPSHAIIVLGTRHSGCYQCCCGVRPAKPQVLGIQGMAVLSCQGPNKRHLSLPEASHVRLLGLHIGLLLTSATAATSASTDPSPSCMLPAELHVAGKTRLCKGSCTCGAAAVRRNSKPCFIAAGVVKLLAC